jgi:hypothetical protein
VDAWSRLPQQQKQVRVVFVAAQDDPALREACGDRRETVRVAFDPDGRLAGLFNARWKPRAYLLDRAGRLAYVQPVRTLTPQAPLEVAALLRRSLQVPQVAAAVGDPHLGVRGGGRPVRAGGELLR